MNSHHQNILRMPYPGLRPFEAEDHPLFFGREAHVGALLHSLEDHKFVAVVGSSGSGKSSLVRAGLLPAVRDGFLLEENDWLILVIKPGNAPYRRLVTELMAVTNTGNKSRETKRQDLIPDDTSILSILKNSDPGLINALDRLHVSKKTMVIVDQFEELFAFRRENSKSKDVITRDEAAAFVSMLLYSCSNIDKRVWVVLTMPSDFIGNCEAFLKLPETVSESQFLVPRLNRIEMTDAITGPANADGTGFKPFTFEAGLVNRIINDAGDRPDQLPLMQHALMRTWKLAVNRYSKNGMRLQLKHDDYDIAGGIDRALSLHADAGWDK